MLARADVVDARDAQQAASKQFKTALERMKEMYNFDGGKLETAYNEFKSEYDDCASRADKVRSRIKEVEQAEKETAFDSDKPAEGQDPGKAFVYKPLIGQPILIYGADRPALSRALERALARNVTPAVYTEDMFKTTHDAANREVVKAVIRAELNLVGLAMRAERKVIDKIVDGLKFHS